MGQPPTFNIRVPASSANLGPGFDTLGIALSLYLDLNVTIPSSIQTPGSTHPHLSISYESHSPEISVIPEENLIMQACMAVSKARGIDLPSMHVHCISEIPYGSGLGSSGSAIVAGVFLANHALNLCLLKHELLPYCLAFEGHPDNVAPSLFGGYVAAYMQTQSLAYHTILPFHHSIRAVVATPSYKLPTQHSRSLLPSVYTREDLVFNLQRCAVLTAAFADPDAKVVYGAMQDRVHQEYRQGEIPGFERCLREIGVEVKGLLGIALSGAGPSVIALATSGFDLISGMMRELLEVDGCTVVVRVLECDRFGARLVD